ncbi:hypothetical protein IE4872_CH03919 [Rhizobium gallicum]|uniref:Uncharacterized protein n=1 Tax=Rhizobium gallicum TaxID=56730 RepID=A0A1L5NNP1_9HYPH|nr:hypothetical protein IE4872_CH03919 [Rhizobium gallicum]
MLLRSMFAQNERSLRSIRMDLSGINLFVGENGTGKGTLRRAIDGWRFFQGLGAERSSPCARHVWRSRHRCSTRTEAIWRLFWHPWCIGEDTVDLDRAIASALGAARPIVPESFLPRPRSDAACGRTAHMESRGCG